MKILEFIKKIESNFPISDICEWDFSGWQVQSSKKDVKIKNILIALDVTEKVINEAINKNVNLIICHHPFIFAKNFDELPFNNWKKLLYKKLLDKKINVYVLHTNFDKSNVGMNFLIAKDLNLKNIRYFDKDKLSVLGEYDNLSLLQVVDITKKYFNFNRVKVVSDNIETKIKKVLLSSGAGGNIIEELDSVNNISLFITGEMKWHQELEAKDKNINVIILGHSMEEKFVNFIYNFLLNEVFNNNKTIQLNKYFFSKSFYI